MMKNACFQAYFQTHSLHAKLSSLRQLSFCLSCWTNLSIRRFPFLTASMARAICLMAPPTISSSRLQDAFRHGQPCRMKTSTLHVSSGTSMSSDTAHLVRFDDCNKNNYARNKQSTESLTAQPPIHTRPGTCTCPCTPMQASPTTRA